MGARHVALVLALAFASLPSVGALPASVDGTQVCATAGGIGPCTTAMMAGTKATLSYTQQTLGCSGSQCDYLRTAHLHLETVAPGEWVLRAETWSTHYPTNTYLSGSRKEIECRVTEARGVCDVAVATRTVVGNPFNSAKWHGEWVLSYVDPLGEEHVQATWSGGGWLAQYCNCG